MEEKGGRKKSKGIKKRKKETNDLIQSITSDMQMTPLLWQKVKRN